MIQIKNFSQIQPLFKYLRKKRQNKKFNNSIELSATFFLISFFLLFAIKPTAFTISALIGEIKAKQSLSQNQMRPRIEKIIQAQDSFASLQKDYQIIESSFPDQPRYSHIATQILVSGYQNNIPLDKITFGLNQNKDTKTSSKSDPNLNKYTISFQINSRFVPAVNLLSQILNNRRLINITKINFSSQDEVGENGDSSLIDISLSADIPYWQQKNEKK